MDNFIYSLNATMPVFLVMILGWWLKRIRFVTDEFVSTADRLVFKVALPVLVFKDIAGADLNHDFNWKFVLFCFFGTCIFFGVTWLLAELFIRDKRMIGSFVQGSFRGSAAILGMAFAQNIYGSSGLVPMMIVASIPLFNIFSVVVLVRSANAGETDKRAVVGKTLKGIVTNPIIIGIAAGIPFAVMEIRFPVILAKTMDSVAALSTPLALITIGAGFSTGKALEKWKPVAAASVIKLVLIPGIFLPAAVGMGFRNEELVALLILTGAPTTVSSYIMAKNMGNDSVLASGIVVMTTLLSSVTLTGIIFILKSFGYI
ncbi:MAG: AEC family transporter [Bacteroidales bacterium]|nr:AEC family transporter [Clostridium sp.]MCM1204840.1 AEC family transporter [Bacteroidales bacterium]